MVVGRTAGAAAIWALTLATAFALGRSSAPVRTENVPDDLAAAIQRALGERDALDRAERTAQLLQRLGPDDIEAVAAVYDRLLNVLGESDIVPFVTAWARFDPKAAMVHALRWSFRDKAEIGAGAAMEAWAMRDPREALEAFEQIRTRHPRFEGSLFLDLLTGWTYSGQPGIEDFIAKLPEAKLEDAISRVAAKKLRNGGVEAVVAWVTEIIRSDAYDPKLKTRAFRRGVRLVARWEPERAAAWTLENRAEPFASEAPRIVAEEWGALDGRAALAWVRDYPDPEARYSAAREAFFYWLRADRKAASEWLQSETLTQFHDPALVVYAKEVGDRAPAEAIDWCERIRDEVRGLRCLERAARLWYTRDPVAAESWLQQSPLDEEARREARTPPDRSWLREMRDDQPRRRTNDRS
jgi:hypothetical protein